MALAAVLSGWSVFVIPAVAQQGESATQGAVPAEAAGPGVVVMQGLDKITARISTFEAPLDQAVMFGTLEIVARACRKRPPEEPPETAAFLEISDVRPDEPKVALFTGWMFASSPALSALEHPVYDVWVIDCR
ncbi:MAG: DUF2155 domain-containing protein [Geminicoccales bacterium]